MEDIGEGGIFVATYQPIEIGDEFELTFTVPGLPNPCTELCEVRWIREYQPDLDTIPGMGLRFKRLSPEAQSAIETFMSQRQPIFYED